MSLISIITPTFNNQETILETWNSVKNQKYENWEWIVVNDGSTDGTKTILEGLKCSKVRVLNLAQSKGVSSARNKGLEVMQGDYFCFLDGDDLLPENSLNARLAVFQSNQEVEFVDGKVISFIDSVDNVIETYLPGYKGNPLKELLSLSGKVFKGNTWMIRRVEGKSYSFLEDLSHGEELLFYASICNTGNYSFTNEPILYYRRHTASAMANVPRLANGYFEIAKALKKVKHIDQSLVGLYKSSASMVSFKSLLKDLKPYLAIIMLFKIKWA